MNNDADNKLPTSGIMNQISATPLYLMAESVGKYEPAPRWGHLAAAVDHKLYLWGGISSDFPEVHDDQAKNSITSVVNVLDLQVN